MSVRANVHNHRRLVAKAAAAALMAALGASMLGSVPAASGMAMDSSRTDANAWVAKYNERLLELVNRRRVAHGLKAAKPTRCAEDWATDWSRHMTNTGKFSHSNLGRLLNKCDASYASENIAMIWDGARPVDLVRMWMHSSGHRANILSRQAKFTGVSVRWDPDQHAWVAVQNFVKH